MRIAIIASGSRGDVEPYVALGKGLQAAGHVVRLVTHRDFESLVTSHGVEFWPVEGSVQDVAAKHGGADRERELPRHPGADGQRGPARRAGVDEREPGRLSGHGPDRGRASAGCSWASLSAEKLGLPLLQAYYIPFTPTRAYPAFVIPKPPSALGTLPNRPSYQVARQMMWQAFRSADKAARREVLGLPAAPFFGPFNSDCVRGQPILYGYSPAVIPPPADWGADIHVTGYWFLDPAEDWTPDAALADFLAGRPAAGLRRLREHEQPESRSNRQSDPGRAGAHGAARHHPRRLGRLAARRICRARC